ncbi:MAG: helix-hairpin-helix domain-containing protein [Lachnospiraceae bacterium]|jgi:competence protein ComEA|nr:helix-hairpin-helix domain-containing protein [Lachnospiraceae bacterium]
MQIKSKSKVFTILIFLCSISIFLTSCSNSRKVSENLNQDKTNVAKTENKEPSANKDDDSTSNSEAKSSTEKIYIHITGAVKHPGVYILEKGARVFNVVKMAGGFSSNAQQNAINQAELLSDGIQIHIPTKKEWESGSTSSVNNSKEGTSIGNTNNTSNGNSNSTSSTTKVNINSADLSALTSLSGIGESRANDIIAYRTQNGNFKSVEEIKNVPGIKDGIYNKIKDQITV